MPKKKSAKSADSAQPSQPGWLRRTLLGGLAVILPTLATIGLLYLLIDFFNRHIFRRVKIAIHSLLEWAAGVEVPVGDPKVDDLISPNWFTDHPIATEIFLTVTAIILALAVLFVVGLLAKGFLGNRALQWGEYALSRIPVVKSIYPNAKQVVGFFFKGGQEEKKFQKVVAIPYPSPEVYSVAFVTSDGIKSLNAAKKGTLISVFIPASPLPMSGFVVFVPLEKVIPLNLEVDDAIRLMVSAGVILPPEEMVELGDKSMKKKSGGKRG